MKAIIPVAGTGLKFRPYTNTQPKALISIAGKKVLSIIIDQLLEVGIQEVVFIVGYLSEKIELFVKENYPKLKSTFVYQANKLGVGHAIYLSKDVIKNDEILIILGDTICEMNLKEFIKQKQSSVVIKKVDDPRDFGVVTLGENNKIESFEEKPIIVQSNIAMVGIYKILETKKFFEFLGYIHSKESAEVQFSLTETLNKMLKHGIKINGYYTQNWHDCGKLETLLKSNSILLKRNNPKVSKTFLKNNIIIPPVSVPINCEISNSVIGPNVAIGEDSKIENSIIQNSIIGSGSQLRQILLKDSFIGSDTNISGKRKVLNIGDNSEISL